MSKPESLGREDTLPTATAGEACWAIDDVPLLSVEGVKAFALEAAGSPEELEPPRCGIFDLPISNPLWEGGPRACR